MARAAHDVLAHYLPEATTLDADLQAIVRRDRPRPRAQQGRPHRRRSGPRLPGGAAPATAAANPDIHYTKPAERRRLAAQRAGQTDMLGGLARLAPTLVVPPEPQRRPVPARRRPRGPTDYEEVRASGSASTRPSGRPTQTATALFYNASNAAMTLGDAVIRYLVGHPQGILETARIFAMMHGALADSLICAWQQKRDVGFWRPFQAIPGRTTTATPRTTPAARLGAAASRNPQRTPTTSAATASATSPQIEVIRRVFGEAHRARAALARPGLRGRTRTCRRSSTRPSTPASGEACTTARR